MSQLPRIVQLFGEIDMEMASKVIGEIMEFETLSKEPILLLINSEGGYCRQAIGIYDILKSSQCEITGLVVGECLSAATLVLQGCHRRLMLQNSLFMMHGGSTSTGRVPFNEFQEAYKRELLEEELMQDILARSCSGKLPPKKFEELNRSGRYLTSAETVQAGFADGIITEREKFALFKRKKNNASH